MSEQRVVKTLYVAEQASTVFKPTRSPEAAPFWQACREQRLVLPRCIACARCHFYPRRFCPFCDSREIAWIEASGRGTIYSFAIVRQPIEKAFAKLVPYTIAIVELEEGVRMLTRVTGNVAHMACDARVLVTFEPLVDDFIIPVFTLAD